MKVLSLSLVIAWIIVFAVVSLAVSLQSSVESQALLGVGLVTIMILIRPFTSTLMARIIFVMLAATLVLRYYFWRLFSTLPDIGLTPEYLAAVILIAVESIAIFQFFVTGFINLDPKKQPKPPEIKPKDFPTVDIFIPTYDEPVDLVKQTAIGAVNMVYPHQKLNVFICDDGGTDERINSSDPDAADFAKI